MAVPPSHAMITHGVPNPIRPVVRSVTSTSLVSMLVVVEKNPKVFEVLKENVRILFGGFEITDIYQTNSLTRVVFRPVAGATYNVQWSHDSVAWSNAVDGPIGPFQIATNRPADGVGTGTTEFEDFYSPTNRVRLYRITGPDVESLLNP